MSREPANRAATSDGTDGTDGTDDDNDKLIGQTLANRYQIETRLGQGAMGAVYRARHIKVGRPFAVKVLHSRLLEDPKVVQRFEREAELAGRLHHPNVIGVVDVGEMADGTRYMVMDFANGVDLSDLLSEAPFPAQRIIRLTRQLLEGLYHAHEQGLIHRDFKPENVIVASDNHGADVPRIVDFGIAILRDGGDSTSGPGRLTTNGLVLGTPHYMAPEQAVADPIDHRIDLFALGIIVYEMLSGRLPFDGNGATVARANLLLDPPRISDRVPFLEVDPLLEAFSRRLMAKKRDVRPPTAKAARELLDLIERDRDAAAAALCVPLESSRAPKTTQQASPVRESLIGRTHETPPQVPALVAPVAVPAPTRSAERAIETEPTRRARAGMSRRGRLAIGGVLLAVAAVGVGVTMHGSGGSQNAAASAPPAPIVAQAPTPAAPAPPVATAPVPPADPMPTATQPAAPAATPETPPVVPAATSKPGRTGPSASKFTHHGDASAKQSSASVPPPAVTPPPMAPPPPVAPPPATMPAVGPAPVANAEPKTLDTNAFTALYRSVGEQLKAYEQAKGGDAASDLWNRYRRILFAEAMASQAKRDESGASLKKIRADMARH